QRAVLVGGYTYGAVAGDEIWEWDGTAWSLRATYSQPMLEPAASWFDFGRGLVVVAGGRDSTRGGFQSDAWSWDGSSLVQIRPNDLPLSRYGFAWAHDPLRRQTLLFGGNASGANGDTWTWDGARWTQHATANGPPARQDAAAAFDAVRGQVVLFGGF